MRTSLIILCYIKDELGTRQSGVWTAKYFSLYRYSVQGKAVVEIVIDLFVT